MSERSPHALSALHLATVTDNVRMGSTSPVWPLRDSRFVGTPAADADADAAARAIAAWHRSPPESVPSPESPQPVNAVAANVTSNQYDGPEGKHRCEPR